MVNDIDNGFIELNTFLRINSLAPTGGQAKQLIRSGLIMVNKETETRNKRKLHAGDVVEYEKRKYIVKSEDIR